MLAVNDLKLKIKGDSVGMEKHMDGMNFGDVDQDETVQVSQVSNEYAAKRAYPGNGIYARRMQRRNAPFFAFKFLQRHQKKLLYIFFTLCLTFGFLADRSGDEGFYMTDAVRGRLMLTSWQKMAALNDVWDFLEVDLMEFVYKSYFPGSDNSTILGYNYILSGIRLRQIRVSPSVCSGPSWLSSLVPGQTSPLLCYPDYSRESEDKEEYGPINGDPLFAYSKGDDKVSSSGELGEYGAGGFILDLPSVNISEAKLRVGRHRSLGWLGMQTRALFIDFSLFNPESKLILRARLLVEVSEFGGLIKSKDFSVYQLQKYGGRNGSLALALDIIFAIIAVFYLAVESIALIQMTGRYILVRPSGLLDILTAFIVFAIIAIRLESKNRIDSQAFTFKFMDGDALVEFEGLQNLPYLPQQDDNLVAILFIMVYGRLVAYSGDVPGVNHLLSAIKRCIIEVAPLMGLVIINFVGFSLAFHVIFGLKMREYRTVGSSFVSNALFLLGETSLYAQMHDSNKVMAGFVCAIFVMSENILLFNLFIAILVNSYAITKSEMEKEPIVLFSEVIQSVVKRISKADPGPGAQPSHVEGKSDREVSGFGSGKNSNVDRDGDVRLNASLNSKGGNSPLAFSPEQAIKSVSSKALLGSQTAPMGTVHDSLAIEESLQEISQGVASFDTVKIQLMAVSEKLNALTDFFLSQPASKTEQHVELINRKLDLLSEALVSTQYRGLSTNANGPGDGVDSNRQSSGGIKSPAASNAQTPGTRSGLRTLGRGSGRVPGWTE